MSENINYKKVKTSQDKVRTNTIPLRALIFMNPFCVGDSARRLPNGRVYKKSSFYKKSWIGLGLG